MSGLFGIDISTLIYTYHFAHVTIMCHLRSVTNLANWSHTVQITWIRQSTYGPLSSSSTSRQSSICLVFHSFSVTTQKLVQKNSLTGTGEEGAKSLSVPMELTQSRKAPAHLPDFTESRISLFIYSSNNTPPSCQTSQKEAAALVAPRVL